MERFCVVRKMETFSGFKPEVLIVTRQSANRKNERAGRSFHVGAHRVHIYRVRISCCWGSTTMVLRDHNYLEES